MNYTLQLGPGRTEFIENTGDFFAVVMSPVDLLIRIPQEEECLYGQGDSRTLIGQTYKYLQVRNPTANAVMVIIDAGTSRYEQRRQAVVDAPTEIVGSAKTSINHLEQVNFPGDPTGSRIRRRSITFSNEDPNARLRVMDAAGNFCSTIEPKSTQILFVSGVVKLYNNSGGAVSFSASEVWFVAS